MELAKTYKVSEAAIKIARELETQMKLSKQAFDLFVQTISAQLELLNDRDYTLDYNTGLFTEKPKPEPEKK